MAKLQSSASRRCFAAVPALKHSTGMFAYSSHQLLAHFPLCCRVQLARVFAPFAPGNLATHPLAALPGLQDQELSMPVPLSASFPTASKRQSDPSRAHVLDLTALDQESGRPASRSNLHLACAVSTLGSVLPGYRVQATSLGVQLYEPYAAGPAWQPAWQCVCHRLPTQLQALL